MTERETGLGAFVRRVLSPRPAHAITERAEITVTEEPESRER